MNSLKQEVLKLDGHKCENPWCGVKKDPKNPFHYIFDVHSLNPPRHESIYHLITFCRLCHDRCENGFNKKLYDEFDGNGNLIGDGWKRISGRDECVFISKPTTQRLAELTAKRHAYKHPGDFCRAVQVSMKIIKEAGIE